MAALSASAIGCTLVRNAGEMTVEFGEGVAEIMLTQIPHMGAVILPLIITGILAPSGLIVKLLCGACRTVRTRQSRSTNKSLPKANRNVKPGEHKGLSHFLIWANDRAAKRTK